MNQVEKGFVLGFFAGQGSFGGDGRTPHLTLRMNVQHEGLLQRLCQILPGSLIYGPYAHGERHYYQWMLRGDDLAKVVEDGVFEELEQWDEPSYARYREMVDRYFVSGKLRFRSKKRRRITSSSGGSSTESV
ncbi:MAG: hypothetical protein JST12_15215 [Armatimonadetes bacterium]|nr:hypothetical protein [Armatimonadota bacterium]